MRLYAWIVILLNFLVDYLLLLGGSRLCGDPVKASRCALGALAGGVYSGLCLQPRLNFLGNPLWHAVSLAGMALIAYGMQRSTLRRGAVFAILSLALSGIALGFGDGGIFSVLAAGGGLCLLCVLGFRSRRPGNAYVPVELSYGDRQLQLTALRDTGNILRDPVTGRPVLVIGADAAGRLTGLSQEQLRSPVESMGALPGLRLVPYRAIGKESGLMLALKLQNVRIGKWKGSSLVAFAPEGLGGDYEALTGGAA